MTEIETIAKGLTEAQKFLVIHGNRPPAYMKELCVTWRQLQRRGIGGDATLKPLGQAVRDYLKGQPC